MISFIAISIFILLAYSLVSLQFDRETEFVDHLLTGHGFVYAYYDTESLSASEIIIMIFFLFIISVVLLNLLIAIMYDSYEKVEGRRVLVDSLEKLDMITEVIVIKRMFIQIWAKLFKRAAKYREIKKEKSYLVFCQDSMNIEDEEDEEDNLLEEKTEILQKAIKRVENQGFQNSNNLTLIEEKIEVLAKTQGDMMSLVKELIMAKRRGSLELKK